MTIEELKELLYEDDDACEKLLELVNDCWNKKGHVFFDLPYEFIAHEIIDMDGDWRLYLHVFKLGDNVFGMKSTYSSWGDCDSVSVDTLCKVEQINVPTWVVDDETD